MAAYVIADTVSVHDTATMDDYRRKVGPTITKHGGKFVVRGGKHEVKERTWQPTRLVIIEFPSRAAAEAWYSDPRVRTADQDAASLQRGPPADCGWGVDQ